VETLVDLPIVLPPAVAGLGLLLAFGRRGPIGGALDAVGIELSFTTVAVVLAQLFVAAPLFVRAARAGLAAVDTEIQDAARVDGAGEAAVFALVTVPLARSALAAGAVLCWARALGEFGATIMFAGNVEGVTQTLPLAVYGTFQVNLDQSIAAGVVLVGAAFVVLAAVRITHWRSALELRRVG
jgi:molybdate transport system permease protein